MKRYILFLFSAALLLSFNSPKNRIACATQQLTGTITTVKSGNWSDPATWGGRLPGINDIALIAAGFTVTADINTTVAGININGVLRSDPYKSFQIQSKGNIIVEGLLEMHPAKYDVQQTITFINIDESKFIGGTMTPADTDPGLWIMNDGKRDMQGTPLTPWTNASTAVLKGDIKIRVNDAAGWHVGQEIVIAPTGTPTANDVDWKDGSTEASDNFFLQFERRIITSIEDRYIYLDKPLVYDHKDVHTKLDTSERHWFPEVANLSRNIRIEGTDNKHRAHIFTMSNVAQNVQYVEGRYLGPRQQSSNVNRGRPYLVLGRYGDHYHHCLDGSRGTIVKGCSFHDIGNRVYVPHLSHGITFEDNIAFNSQEAQLWWDFQDLTHDMTAKHNLFMASRWNGTDASIAADLGQGENNVMENNTAVYCHTGDYNNKGAFFWNANNESPWAFRGNMVHSSGCAYFFWQNTDAINFVDSCDAYNCTRGFVNGAYGNKNIYNKCYFANAPCQAEASSTAPNRCVFDGMGIAEEGLIIFNSPAGQAEDYPTTAIQCVFGNFTKTPVRFFPLGDETLKIFDFVSCTGAEGYKIDAAKYKDGWKIRTQPKSGQPYQDIVKNGVWVRENIASFAPYNFGDGDGLTTTYYRGSNFEEPVLTTKRQEVRQMQANINSANYPFGESALLDNTNYSVLYEGYIKPQFNKPYTFRMPGGGNRLWINGVKVIDVPVNASEAYSQPVKLNFDKLNDIRIEHYVAGRASIVQLAWQCEGIPFSVTVPFTQLYTKKVSAPLPVFFAVDAGEAQTITGKQTTISASVSGDNGLPVTYLWKPVLFPKGATGNIVSKNNATTEVKNITVVGIYTLEVTATRKDGVVVKDTVQVTKK